MLAYLAFRFPRVREIALSGDFLYGLKLREMPCFKGFRDLASLNLHLV
jgi:hypothetical protein